MTASRCSRGWRSGIVIFPHGAQKVLGLVWRTGIDGALGFYTSMGVPAFLGWMAMTIELVGGIALIVGILGRVAAFAVALDMVVAVIQMHWMVGFFMNWDGQLRGEGFEFHILAVTLALIVIIRGSGALSLDRVIMTRPVVVQPAP